MKKSTAWVADKTEPISQEWDGALSGASRSPAKQMSTHCHCEMLAVVDEEVASGDYASGSEASRDGLRALNVRDKAAERWLSGRAVPTITV